MNMDSFTAHTELSNMLSQLTDIRAEIAFIYADKGMPITVRKYVDELGEIVRKIHKELERDCIERLKGED